jgi:hypothetical protein
MKIFFFLNCLSSLSSTGPRSGCLRLSMKLRNKSRRGLEEREHKEFSPKEALEM